MKGGRLGRAAAAAVIVVSSAAVFAAPASAQLPAVKFPIPRIPIPTPVGPINTPSVNCKPPPAIRSSAGQPVSAMFDGAPADPNAVLPSSDVYVVYGAHPLSWAVYDPGCAGDVAQPTSTLDTFLGDQLLGAGQDVAAFANGVHRLVARPTWLGAFDRFETNATATLKTRVWDVFLPLSLVIVGLLVMSRSHRGNMAVALRMVGWAFLVMLVVTVVASEPVRVGRLADQLETGGVNSINGALSGSNVSPAAAGSLEMNSVLFPAWERGEIGSDTSGTAQTYGRRLLDGTAYQWQELRNGVPVSKKVTEAKQAEFKAAAAAVQSSDPGAYTQLQGKAGGRVGSGISALVGVLVTVPFRLAADLLVVASLLLLRLEVVLLPLVAVVAIHHHYRHVLTRGVLTVTLAALINAAVFSAAAAVNVLVVGFLLDPANGLPMWFGLVLAGLLAVVLFYVLKPFRRLTRMVSAADVSHAVSHTAHQITHTVGQTVAKVGAGSVGGRVGLAAATAVAARETVADDEHGIPDVDPGPASEGERASPGPGPTADATPVDDSPLAPLEPLESLPEETEPVPLPEEEPVEEVA